MIIFLGSFVRIRIFSFLILFSGFIFGRLDSGVIHDAGFISIGWRWLFI